MKLARWRHEAARERYNRAMRRGDRTRADDALSDMREIEIAEGITPHRVAGKVRA